MDRGLKSVLLLLLAHAAASPVSSQNDRHPALVSAVASYERDFVREIEPIQQKYVRALDQFQRNFTRSGNLEAAEWARREAARARLWKTVAFHTGQRTLSNVELTTLLQNYEAAVARVAQPMALRHLENLEQLKDSLARSGNLDGSLQVADEMEKVRSGEAFPARAGLRMAYESFSKEEFARWLQEQNLEFTGKIAGKTSLKFDGKQVSYGSDTSLGTVSYPYEIDTFRSVDIDSGRFRIEFSKDLVTGTFESRDGVYELRVLESDFEGPSSSR